MSDESQKSWDEPSAEPGETVRAADAVRAPDTAGPASVPKGDPIRHDVPTTGTSHSPEAPAEEVPAESAHDAPVPEPPVVVAVAEDQPAAKAAGAPETNGAKSAEATTSAEETATAEETVSADEPPAADAGETAEESPPPKSGSMDWYILKVQSNREESIRDGLLRRVKIAGLDYFFDEVVVPTETVSEYKDGKRRTRKQKIWPGYIVVHMEINEDTWFLVRETPGIGDFTGAGGKPTPMKAVEVEKILKLVHPEKHAAKEKTPVKIAFQIGDRVKIKEGTFQNFDGEVGAIDHTNGRVTVMTEIFNRKTPVELDYWQVERI